MVDAAEADEAALGLRATEAFGEVHREVFGEIRPATTIVEVAKLIDKEAQIEIEADAIVA